VVDETGGRSITLIDEFATGDGADTGRDQLLDIALGPALLQQIEAAGGPETQPV
jgi:hypothetical protein